ncbi:2Fe-2S iron-sulfur cluster-binding protein [Streptomyces sediminimaris]|uniref:2Fe-2S iron-sulfur cluster-binding protein n=1 Tax=Streptomyces sediminimaris TaxID=3383721 RepID=UPI00399B3087
MTDDQHGEHAEGTPRGGGRWDPLPQGDYDDGATAFVKLPEGGIDALLAAEDSPLAARGHGYVPPPITPDPEPAAGAEPAAGGAWGAPADGARWPDPNAVPQDGADDRFRYNPAATQQWSFGETAGTEPPAPGHDVTGQWSIPVAGGDLPDESGEFTTSSLVQQWGGTPPATLPGGAPAPWATEGAGQPWGRPQDEEQAGPGEEPGPAHAPAGPPEGTAHPYERPAADPGEHPPQRSRPAAHPPGEQPPAAHETDGARAHTAEPPRPPGAEDHDRRGAGDHAPPATGDHVPPAAGDHARSGAGDPYAQAPAEGRYAEAPAGGRYAETAARGSYAEAPADGPYAGTAAAGRHTEAPAAGPYAETPDEAAAAAAQGTHEPGEAPGADEGAQGAAEAAEAAEAAVQRQGPAQAAGRVSEAPEGASEVPEGASEVPGGRARAAGDAASGPAAPDAPVPPGAPAGPQPADGRDAEDPEDAAPPPFPGEEHPLASYVLRVNGVERPVSDAWIGESLLYVLRERLGLAGAKDGCSQGECGACNVQVDGRLVASCLVPAVTAAGSEVRTVEGLAVDGQPSDVQRALARCGAVQCGFCVPGIAMTVHDLLEGNPAPTRLETRQALCGNLCRCSGYRGVVEAVQEVVAEREALSAGEAAEPDGDEARIPHQAGPGAGGVNPSAFESPGAPAAPGPHDQPYGQDGGQA